MKPKMASFETMEMGSPQSDWVEAGTGGSATAQPKNQLRYAFGYSWRSCWRGGSANDCHRAVLVERHVNMMSFSQCVGIGLFLQAGRVIYLAGPGLATVAYVLAGTVLWSSAACL